MRGRNKNGKEKWQCDFVQLDKALLLGKSLACGRRVSHVIQILLHMLLQCLIGSNYREQSIYIQSASASA